jgi:glycosyltransferase involved in cell wall biosynthesis
MRIALLSTCALDVPPAAYGGTERFVADLAECLVRRGHDVVVYATGSSHPAGQLRWRFERPIWPPDSGYELEHANWAWRDIRGRRFDIVHVNAPEALVARERVDMPTVVTVHHARSEDLNAMMQKGGRAHLVAISRRQAELVPELAMTAIIHHGLAPRMYPAGTGAGGYAAFLGRFAPEKAPHIAIDAAMAAGVPIRLGGPRWQGMPAFDRYFDAELRPRFEQAGSALEWLGELDHTAKLHLLRGARALLMPIEWEEPFGLVMIEAMLVGTPVISFARGAAPEIVEDGVTGFLVRDQAEMTARLAEVDRIDRNACRARAQERWSSDRMAADYERLYLRILGVGERACTEEEEDETPLAASGAARPSAA